VFRYCRGRRPSWPQRARLLVPLLVVCVVASGCVSYRPDPLATADLVTALERRSVSSDELRANSGAPFSPDDGLSLEEAESVALFYNPRLRTARLTAQVPVVGAEFAGLWDDPTLGGDVMRILEDVDKPWIVGTSLGFSLPISGSRLLEGHKADAEARAALVEAWSQEQDVLSQLRDAWFVHRAARESLAASRTSLEQLETIVAITDRLETAGELITAEAIAFRLALARARHESERMDASVRVAEREVLALLGLLPGTPIVWSTQAEPFALPAREDILASNPRIVLAAANHEVAERALRLEVRRQYPDLELGPAYGREDGEDRLGVGFSVPIPILNANRRAIAEAQATRDAARAAWEEATHQALIDAATAAARLTNAESQHRALRDDIAPLAVAQLNEARRLADQGEVNALLLLEALEAQRETTIEAIEADSELAAAQAALRSLAPAVPPQLQPITMGGDVE